MTVYQTVTPGTTITASWGNNVRDGLINSFASAAARNSAITSPVDGMIVYLADTDTYERYKASTGGWRRLDWEDSWGTVGGKRYLGSSAFATGIAAGELYINMDSGTVTLLPGRSYRWSVRVFYTSNGVAIDYWIFKLRRNSVSGAQAGDLVVRTDQNNYGVTSEFVLDQPDIGVSAITDTWVLTAQRLSGGTDSLAIARAPSNPTYVMLHDMGPLSRVTVG